MKRVDRRSSLLRPCQHVKSLVPHPAPTGPKGPFGQSYGMRIANSPEPAKC
jgi:hypothetical protein